MANINELSNDRFMDVLIALKENSLRSCNVCDLAIVESVDSTNKSATCCLLSNTSTKIIAYIVNNDSFSENELALIIYANTDFRTNLRKWRSSNGDKSKLNVSDSTNILHSKNYGIMIKL